MFTNKNDVFSGPNISLSKNCRLNYLQSIFPAIIKNIFFSILHLSSACEKSPELCVCGIELNVLQLFISFVFVWLEHEGTL